MMNLRLHFFAPQGAVVAALFLSVSTLMTRAEDTKGRVERPSIYDSKADGEKQIQEALKTAKKDNKRVLLKFGANWCVWCHRLHGLFVEDKTVAAALKKDYVLVLIDVDTVDGKKHNEKVDAKYGNPTKQGLPVLLVLDSEGKLLITQPTDAFEVGDHHDPEKVLSFLKKWSSRNE